jgi:transposase-like protein
MKHPDKHCDHCDHYVGGYANGMGSAGEDRFQCCFCGRVLVRKWVSGADPEHGPYHSERVKCYKDQP